MSPTSAPFSVKRDGTVSLKNGLIQCGIDVGNGAFSVDSNGNVNITSGSINIGNGNFIVDNNGNVIIKNGSISWSSITGTDGVGDQIQEAIDTAEDAYDRVQSLADGTFVGGTFIDGTSVSAPEINGGEIYGGTFYGCDFYADNGYAYAHMNGTSFELINSGSSNPQAILSSAENNVQLILGTGTGTSQTAGRFYIQKVYSSSLGNVAGITYVTSTGNPIGIMFNDDGSMTFVADEFIGLPGGSGTAVFG